MTNQNDDPLFCEVIADLEAFEVKNFMAHLLDAAIVIKDEIISDRVAPNSHYKTLVTQREWLRRDRKRKEKA